MIPYITLSIHDSQSTCPVASETLAYNLNNLLTTEGHLQYEFNPMKKVTNWVEKNTGYICIANLFAMGLKFLIFYVSVGVTMIQEGAAGVSAILYVFWCQSKINSKCIIQKGQRKHKAEVTP